VNALLDVLVTVSKDTPEEFVQVSKNSVDAAVKKACYPIQVITVPGVPGHVGQAMMNGLKLSTAKYVCWVDDDDWVVPRAFAILTDALATEPTAVCTHEMRTYKNGHQERFGGRHHLVAFKAAWIKDQDLTPFKATPLTYLMKHLPNDVIDIPDPVYFYRIRQSSALKLRRLHTQKESLLW
jgi:glycosyltransferase involved in cell wall biosynthesis